MTGTSERCQRCGSTSTLTVAMPATRTGERLTMTSCMRCEQRLWTTTAGTVAVSVSVPEVLRSLLGRNDFALTPTVRPTRQAVRRRSCASD